MNTKLLLSAAAAALACASATQAAAASFVSATASQVDTAANRLRYARTAGSGATAAYAVSSITREGELPLYELRLVTSDGLLSPIQAALSFSATTSVAATLSGPENAIVRQGLEGGLLSFTVAEPLTLGDRTGTILLSVQFTGGQITGTLGSNSLLLEAGGQNGSVAYSSDFFDFEQTGPGYYSFSLTNVTLPVALAGSSPEALRLRALTATASASFSTTAVPEPATWALMIGGFGMVGASMRRRTRALITHA
jgi:hypothetical protein